MPKPKLIIGIRDFIDLSLSAFVLRARRLGVTANHITLLQAPFVIVMFHFLLQKHFLIASLLLSITLILDILDGAWARITSETSAKGHLYDKALDLFGIYTFLAGIFIASNSLSLRSLVVALGIVNAVLYFSNEFVQPELYCGVRTFGFIGLLGFSFMNFAISAALIVGLVMLIVKVFKFQAQRKQAGGQTAASPEQKQI